MIHEFAIDFESTALHITHWQHVKISKLRSWNNFHNMDKLTFGKIGGLDNFYLILFILFKLSIR